MKWFNTGVISVFISLVLFIGVVGGQNDSAFSAQDTDLPSQLHNIAIKGQEYASDVKREESRIKTQEGFGGGESVSQAEVDNTAPLTYQGDDEDEPNIEAKVALVWDIESGQELYQKNSTERYQLASITKLLTAAIVLDNYTYGQGEWVTMT